MTDAGTLQLFTIGAYGWSAERFSEALTSRGIDTFCDIRARRGVRGSEFAFVNSTRLQEQLSKRGIRYVHRLDVAPSNELRSIQGKADEAVTHFRIALQFRPHSAEAYNNLGNVWKDQGEVSQAIAAYRQAMVLQPDNAAIHSNLLLTLNYSPDYDAQMILEESRLWNKRHAERLAKFMTPHENERSPERPSSSRTWPSRL